MMSGCMPSCALRQSRHTPQGTLPPPEHTSAWASLSASAFLVSSEDADTIYAWERWFPSLKVSSLTFFPQHSNSIYFTFLKVYSQLKPAARKSYLRSGVLTGAVSCVIFILPGGNYKRGDRHARHKNTCAALRDHFGGAADDFRRRGFH